MHYALCGERTLCSWASPEKRFNWHKISSFQTACTRYTCSIVSRSADIKYIILHFISDTEERSSWSSCFGPSEFRYSLQLESLEMWIDLSQSYCQHRKTPTHKDSRHTEMPERNSKLHTQLPSGMTKKQTRMNFRPLWSDGNFQTSLVFEVACF